MRRFAKSLYEISFFLTISATNTAASELAAPELAASELAASDLAASDTAAACRGQSVHGHLRDANDVGAHWPVGVDSVVGNDPSSCDGDSDNRAATASATANPPRKPATHAPPAVLVLSRGHAAQEDDGRCCNLSGKDFIYNSQSKMGLDWTSETLN